MKFINLLSVFIFIISQNILMASSAYAATQIGSNVVITNKETVCATVCNTMPSGSASTTYDMIFALDASATAFINNAPRTKTYTFTTDASQIAAEAIAACISNCEDYRGLVGYTLGNLDAPSNLSSNTLSKAVCNAFRIVTGGAGKTFASFAVIATGIGFFTGKVSWGLMIGVAAGIATMFGASSIVAAISGEKVETQCDINFKQ